MKLKIATVLMAGIVGMTMLVAGGCCHMHRHSCDKQSCCSKSCCDQCSKCDKQANCDKCDKTVKPCCDKTAPQAPKAEQK
jgi:cobalamin biosynthesis protein CbiD